MYILFLIGTLISYQCATKESTQNQIDESILSITQESFENEYEYIGKAHNDSLDSYFNLIESQNFDSLDNKIDYLVAILEGNHGSSILQKVDKIINSSTYQDSLINAHLSEGQISYLEEIFRLVELNMQTIALKDSLDLLNSASYNELGPDSSNIVLIASSVAINSKEYWEQNYNNWELLFTENQNSLMKISEDEPGGVTVIKYDISGAIVGACIGGPKGALGVGVVASAIEMCVQILGWIFGSSGF